MVMKRISFSTALLIFVVALLGSRGNIAHSQARREVTYDYSQNQFTALYQHTIEDYSLQHGNGASSRVQLNGAAAEYSWRRYYPFEIVGRATYSFEQELGQKLISFTAGVGYTRQIHRRYFPFVRITGGVAHTSSQKDQYLYGSGASGFAMNLAGGLDINITNHLGIRAAEFQNQYLPFGLNDLGSVYWTFGTGAYFRFGK